MVAHPFRRGRSSKKRGRRTDPAALHRSIIPTYVSINLRIIRQLGPLRSKNVFGTYHTEFNPEKLLLFLAKFSDGGMIAQISEGKVLLKSWPPPSLSVVNDYLAKPDNYPQTRKTCRYVIGDCETLPDPLGERIIAEISPFTLRQSHLKPSPTAKRPIATEPLIGWSRGLLVSLPAKNREISS
jgi:hypothetical protein